jgi:RNA polymerase sigma factor (sigma-70 family)
MPFGTGSACAGGTTSGADASAAISIVPGVLQVRETAEQALLCYEGLVKQTARMLIDGTHPDMRGRKPMEWEEEDVEQVLRIKVLAALRVYDPSRWKKRGARGQSPRDMYVYMAVRDKCKDLVKLRRRHDRYIEDLAPGEGPRDGVGNGLGGQRDRFEARYLCETADQAFAEVEDALPPLPATLTERERKVLLLMYEEHRQTEIARMLGFSKREVESAVRQIRVKMAAWRPSSD